MAIELVGMPSNIMREEDKVDFRCPKCAAIRPPYQIELNGADFGIIGAMLYATIFCGAPLPPRPEAPADAKPEICGAIFSVSVIEWQKPRDPLQLAALMKHLRDAHSGGKPRA